jgi:transcriptional regulator with XRE-family HTH domain
MTLNEYLAKEQLTPASFAREIGVPSSTVHRWSRGKRQPSMALLPKIEKFTGGDVRAKDFYPAHEAAE